ncbi:MAG: hypothetical protein QM652_10355 [Legionella sp.]|uniref:hypothetical protein n=1 Tax=Legionella sp. TaxID=459 RepID=UPI0039E618E5
MTHLNESNTSELQILINEFNEISEENAIHRLFLLQKINAYLMEHQLNKDTFKWLNENPKTIGSWESVLGIYKIIPEASFLLKSIQFANAVAAEAQEIEFIKKTDLYQLLQERDKLLSTAKPTDEDLSHYTTICCQIKYIAETNKEWGEKITYDLKILQEVQNKIKNIKGHIEEKIGKYATEPLGKGKNNENFILHIDGFSDPFVICVKDLRDLKMDSSLYSNSICRYFVSEIAVFMMPIKEEDDSDEVNYKPIVLSHFANQGDLETVARELRNKKISLICSQAVHYFNQIVNFCIELKKLHVYHPDMKLSNLLVHNGLILLADRKTFIAEPTPVVSEVRSSPWYAPDEYNKCLNKQGNCLKSEALRILLNMEQFMHYQVGMALKEFLLLSQRNDLPESFRDQNDSVINYFPEYSRQIVNFQLIISALTHITPEKRLPIESLPSLFACISRPNFAFYEVFRESHSDNDDEDEKKEIYTLLKDNTLTSQELLKRTHLIFNNEKLSLQSGTLSWLAAQLALKCYAQSSKDYYNKLLDLIDKEIDKKNWTNAPWYLKLASWLSFGYYKVPQSTISINEINIDVDWQNEEFQTHISILKFLPDCSLKSLGEKRLQRLTQFIEKNQDKIISKSCDDESASKAGPTAIAMKRSQSTIRYPSGSVVYNDYNEDKEKSKSNLSSKDKNPKTSSNPVHDNVSKKYSSCTMFLNPKKLKRIKDKQPPKTENEDKPHKPGSLIRRGDGSIVPTPADNESPLSTQIRP